MISNISNDGFNEIKIQQLTDYLPVTEDNETIISSKDNQDSCDEDCRFYNISINPTPLNEKPVEEKEVEKIYFGLSGPVSLTIDQFAEATTQPLGYTWSGGIFSGFLNNSTWLKQSVFALDFDKGLLSVDQVYERFAYYGITPQVWYSSFSDSPQLRKFRVVLFLDHEVNDICQHKFIADGLLSLFPEADQQCRNASRFFYGGNQSNVVTKIPTSLENLVNVLAPVIINTDGGRTRKLNDTFNLGINKKEDGRKWYFLYNYYRSYHFLPEEKKSISDSGEILEKIDFEVARKKIKVIDKFLNGVELKYHSLYGLATNLIYVNGGAMLMKETMEKYNELGVTHYKENDFKIFTYLKAEKYPPKLLKDFSDYPEDKELFDVISETKNIRGEVIQLEEIKKIKPEEANGIWKKKLNYILSEGETGKIYILCLPSGIGKTEALTTIENVVLAFPTNKLKNDVSQRRMKIDHSITPDPIEFNDPKLQNKLDSIYKIGLSQKATSLIHEVGDLSCPSKKYSFNDQCIAARHIQQISDSLKAEQTLLTSHNRAFFTEFNQNTIIFDEDPISQIISVKQASISDLYSLKYQSPDSMKPSITKVIEDLESALPFQVNDTPNILAEMEDSFFDMELSNINTKIFEFFASNYFIRDEKNQNNFFFIKRNELPVDKKIIIMSATVPVFIYEKLFGDRVEVLDIRDIKQKGSITQYTKRSYSRSGIRNYGEEIKKVVNGSPVLTFKGYDNYFNNPIKDIYFGNSCGYDSYKGKNMIVVGTPHRNQNEYFLIAKEIGLDLQPENYIMIYQRIDFNGFRFMFNCFNNEELRKIQLTLITSDLIQAVGRSRLLWENAHVDLYSNLPLRISDEFVY